MLDIHKAQRAKFAFVFADYTKDTVKLSEVVDKYFTLDSFDPERANVVKVDKHCRKLCHC